MSDGDEFLKEVSEEEQKWYEEQETELLQDRYEEALFYFKKSLEDAKIISIDMTLNKNLDSIKKLIEIISKYEVWLFHQNYYPYKMKDTQCFCIKLTEIISTLYDILFLLSIGMYNASRVLIRKFMELSIISIHMDTKENNDKTKKLWMASEDMGSSGFGWRLKQLLISNPKDIERVKQIYKGLSIYVHNEGKNNLYILYDENQFFEIFKIICEGNELIQKILEENYKGMKK